MTPTRPNRPRRRGRQPSLAEVVNRLATIEHDLHALRALQRRRRQLRLKRHLPLTPAGKRHPLEQLRARIGRLGLLAGWRRDTAFALGLVVVSSTFVWFFSNQLFPQNSVNQTDLPVSESIDVYSFGEDVVKTALDLCIDPPEDTGKAKGILTVTAPKSRTVELLLGPHMSVTPLEPSELATGECSGQLNAPDSKVTIRREHADDTSYSYWSMTTTSDLPVQLDFEWQKPHKTVTFTERSVFFTTGPTSEYKPVPYPSEATTQPAKLHAVGTITMHFPDQDRLLNVYPSAKVTTDRYGTSVTVTPGDAGTVLATWDNRDATDIREVLLVLWGSGLGVLGGALANLMFSPPRRHAVGLTIVIVLLVAIAAVAWHARSAG